MTPALIISAILVLTIAIDSGLLLFIVWRMLSRERGPIYWLLIAHLLGILGWAGSIFFLLHNESTLAAQLTFAFALCFSYAKYWFARVFPENILPTALKNYWSVPFAVLALVLSFLPNALFTSIRVIQNYYIEVDNGPYAGIYALIITFLLIYPLYILYQKRKQTAHPIVRNQLKFLSIGFTIFLIVALLTNSILPVFFHIYFFNGIGPSFSLVLAAFMIYVIFRHRFLDIRVVIQQSAIYMALLSLAIGTYLLFIGILGFVFQRGTHLTVLFSAGVTMLVGVVGAPVVEKYFRRLTDPLFFKDTYNYADALNELTRILNRNLELNTIVGLSEEALFRTLKSEAISFLFCAKARGTLRDSAEILEQMWSKASASALRQLRVIHSETLTYPRGQSGDPIGAKERNILNDLSLKYKAELLIPITLEDKLVGMLFVGAKRSGDGYSAEDTDLLESFASQLAVAFEKILLYEKVAAYSESLEQKVEERTREIVLLREQERQMMADISHGLQTPLTIVKSELGKLKQQLPETGHFNAFERSIDMISKFIYDLLTLARLDKTENIAPLEPIDFSELVSDLAEYTTIPAEAEGITVSEAIAPNIFVSGEKDRLTEAIVNILGNAMKYIGREGKKGIAVALSADSTHALLTISDTGIGIPESDLPHLFERFYRVNNNEAKHPKGTGLGLAITKRIIERHGGSISVKSTLGKGTTFTITLPLEQASQ